MKLRGVINFYMHVSVSVLYIHMTYAMPCYAKPLTPFIWVVKSCPWMYSESIKTEWRVEGGQRRSYRQVVSSDRVCKTGEGWVMRVQIESSQCEAFGLCGTVIQLYSQHCYKRNPQKAHHNLVRYDVGQWVNPFQLMLSLPPPNHSPSRIGPLIQYCTGSLATAIYPLLTNSTDFLVSCIPPNYTAPIASPTHPILACGKKRIGTPWNVFDSWKLRCKSMREFAKRFR